MEGRRRSSCAENWAIFRRSTNRNISGTFCGVVLSIGRQDTTIILTFFFCSSVSGLVLLRFCGNKEMSFKNLIFIMSEEFNRKSLFYLSGVEVFLLLVHTGLWSRTVDSILDPGKRTKLLLNHFKHRLMRTTGPGRHWSDVVPTLATRCQCSSTVHTVGSRLSFFFF